MTERRPAPGAPARAPAGAADGALPPVSSREFRIAAIGDSALVVLFEARIDPAINVRAIRLAEALERSQIEGMHDVVPAYRSVAVYFDPLRTNYDVLIDRIEREAARPDEAGRDNREVVEIPVCYGGLFGPDLEGVASFAGLSEQEVIARHTSVTYRVFMLGFVPGFAYMGIVDERIAAPRHRTPRVRVPKGSVGIAGAQTGVYPAETPGGWQLIGRTPLDPFDPRRPEPFLMRAGDAVRFAAIERGEYDRLARARELPQARGG